MSDTTTPRQPGTQTPPGAPGQPSPSLPASGWRLTRTLVLVGLMGAGKTSVGKRLAALLGVGFVDTDAEIEAAAAMSIPEIFERLGESAFRDGERRVISRLLGEGPQVLSTGGGAFVQAATRGEIAAHARSVWLRADVRLLWQRVRDRPGRPLLQVADPRAALEALHQARAPIYALADVIVDSRRGDSQDAMAQRIVEAIAENDAAHPDREPTLRPVVPIRGRGE